MLAFEVHKRFMINLALAESAHLWQLSMLTFEVHKRFMINSALAESALCGS